MKLSKETELKIVDKATTDIKIKERERTSKGNTGYLRNSNALSLKKIKKVIAIINAVIISLPPANSFLVKTIRIADDIIMNILLSTKENKRTIGIRIIKYNV